MADKLKKRGSSKKKTRWGSVSELDKRIHVGTETFQALPRRLQHLAAWRRMNSQGHTQVRDYGTLKKVRPSSNLSLKLKIEYVKTYVDG